MSWHDAQLYCEREHRLKLVAILSVMDQVALMSYIDQLHGHLERMMLNIWFLLPRDALQCKARYCYRPNSNHVCMSATFVIRD